MIEEHHHDEIVISRPTGPRITATPRVSLGQLVVRKTRAAGAVAKVALTPPLAFIGRHKTAFVSMSFSAVLTLCADLLMHSAQIGLATVGLLSFAHNPQQPGGYVGPGDLAGLSLPASSTGSCPSVSCSGFAGLRAFSQAQIPAGSCPGDPKCTKAATICDRATGATCVDAYIAPNGYIATTGLKDAPGQPCYPNSTTASPTCAVQTLYDQLGNANFNFLNAYGATFPAYAPATEWPMFVFDGPNGYPAMYDNVATQTTPYFGAPGWSSSEWLDVGVPYMFSTLVKFPSATWADQGTFYGFVAQGGENIASVGSSAVISGNSVALTFASLYGSGFIFHNAGAATQDAWHSTTLLQAGGGQTITPFGTGTCSPVTFAGGSSPNITIAAPTVQCDASDTFNVGDLIGFGGEVQFPALPAEVGYPYNIAKAFYVKSIFSGIMTISATLGGPAITFATTGSGSLEAARARSYFMTDGAMDANCNPCWGGREFGYSAKHIFFAEGFGYSAAPKYMMEHALWSSRDLTLTPAKMALINANQCQAYGGLC